MKSLCPDVSPKHTVASLVVWMLPWGIEVSKENLSFICLYLRWKNNEKHLLPEQYNEATNVLENALDIYVRINGRKTLHEKAMAEYLKNYPKEQTKLGELGSPKSPKEEFSDFVIFLVILTWNKSFYLIK